MIRTVQLTRQDLIDAINDAFKDYSNLESVAVLCESVDYSSDDSKRTQSILFVKNLDIR